MKIGLLGGSFDPVHCAHIALALAARRSLGMDRVQLIPAANPWQREPLATSAHHRLAMLNIAVRGHEGLEINPLEITRGGKTYTADTLSQLPPGPDYTWILGADQLGNFCSWHRWEAIAATVTLAVARRPGTELAVPAALRQRLEALNRRLVELPFEPMDISATAIRRRLALGLPTDGMLDVAVAQYIKENHLYQGP